MFACMGMMIACVKTHTQTVQMPDGKDAQEVSCKKSWGDCYNEMSEVCNDLKFDYPVRSDHKYWGYTGKYIILERDERTHSIIFQCEVKYRK